MNTILVLLVVLWAGVGWANHLSATIETLECSERNHHCGQALGHDSPSMPQVDTDDMVTIHSSPTGCYASFGSPPRQVEVECQEPQGLPVPVCLKKMEAAMRAMEKQFYYKSGGRMIFPFKPEGEPIPGSAEPLITQWTEAKACWRKP